jgi:hypothetical protein
MFSHWCVGVCLVWFMPYSWALAQSESELPPERVIVPSLSPDGATQPPAENDALLKSIQEKAALPPLPQQLHQPLRIIPPPPGAKYGLRALSPGSLPPRIAAERGPRVQRPAQGRAATTAHWKAAEAMLRSARWLEQDAATADAEGHVGQAVQLRNMAASLREHVKQLINVDP